MNQEMIDYILLKMKIKDLNKSLTLTKPRVGKNLLEDVCKDFPFVGTYR